MKKEIIETERKVLGSFTDKENYQFLLYPAVFFASVFFFFGPIQMYVSNITELWFPIHDAIFPCFVVFLIVSAILLLLGRIIMRNDVAFHIYVFLLWGLGIALYVQGNFIPSNYGVLNGASIDWDAHAKEAMMNVLFWVFCLLLPYFLRVFAMKYYRTIIRYTSGGLFLVQLVALVILFLTTDFSQSAISESYLSDAGLYEVSDEQNVIIFVLDTFDKSYFEEISEKTPDFLDYLDGFTSFSNTTSPYPATRLAIPYLLTQQYYENEQPYDDYIEEAWENCADYYQMLTDYDYNIQVYTSLDTAISDKAKKKWIDNAIEDRVKVSSHIGLTKELLHLTAMRLFPDIAKKYVWSYDDLFNSYKSSIEGYTLPFNWEEQKFYQDMVNDNLTISKKKLYKFIHLDGVHTPFTLNEDLTEEITWQEDGGISEAKAALNVIREYIRQLKVLNIYDQSLIIITADHGYSGFTAPNPIFLIKNFNSHGDLEYSNVPISHSNIMATVSKECCFDNIKNKGISVFDVDENTTEYRRHLLYTLQGSFDKEYVPDMVEYNILPDSNDIESFFLTGRIYTKNGILEFEPYKCDVGTPIKFDNIESASHFADRTTVNVDNGFIWSIGYKGRAYFRLGEINDDLILHIRLHNWIMTDSQHIIISSRDNILFDSIVTSDMPYINLIIPHESVINGLLTLDFRYPDACSSMSLGLSETDNRILAVGYKEMLFAKLEETSNIIFSSSLAGNAADYIYSGWHAIEEKSAWTNEKASIVAILPENGDRRMAISYWTHPGAEDTFVYYNDHLVGTLPHHDEGNTKKEFITLPDAYRLDSDAQIITFVTHGATTSKEYYGGNVTDERILGIAVSEIDFIPSIQLGSNILFSDDLSRCYFESGVESYTEEDLLWSIGNSSHAVFGVGEIKNDLMFRIRLHDWMPGGKQHVVIQSKEMILYDGDVTNDTPYIYFSVPMECVDDGQLILDFEYPNACSPKSLGGSEDERTLAIGFKEIYFTEQEETTELHFNDMGNADDSLITGWYDAEAGWCWTDGTAQMAAMLPENGNYEMRIRYWTHPGAGETAVYYNGELIGRLPHHGEDALETVETVILPENGRAVGSLQQITLVTDGAMTSREYYGGDVTDDRVLGIAVVEISFSVQE